MKLRRFVFVMMFLTAITFGCTSALKADASGAPYIIHKIPIQDGDCTIYWIDYSNGDWSFELGPGCR